jgi:glutamate--cysteine ligase
VTTHSHDLDIPIPTFDDLLRPFHDAQKPKAEWRVGAEMEKVGIFSKTGKTIGYEGEIGIPRVLQYLADHHGWIPEAEKPGGPLIALLRKGASVTLEPGGQLELSGAPLETIHEICAEFREHMKELAPISKELGVTWLGLGFNPFAKRADLSFVPKQRYAFMREYLPTRGSLALDMMLRTCTVQANFDYANERDAMRKLRVSLKLSPLTAAIFANSPWYEGARYGGTSYRAKVWLDVDPDRSGLLPMMWKEDATFETYVEWALDVPMFIFKRGGEPVANTGQTFRSFWKEGFQGFHATQNDWQTHLNTLFPEVRLKKTIELRAADAQTAPLVCALPALFTGILYDDRALDEATELTAKWTYEDVQASRPDVWKLGVRAKFGGEQMSTIAVRLIEIAEGGLERRAFKRPDGKDERVHLARLKELLSQGKSPADRLLETTKDDSVAAILASTDLSATS